MPRKLRVDLPDSMHHVTALGGGDEPIYREPADRRHFLAQLGDVCARYEWRCNSYCLMGTHFHLIVYTVQPTLSAGMRRLCGSYAQWFNWKYGRRGHLFAGRFASKPITDDAQLLEAHRYVALNPVRANLCDDPAEWRWGSYRALCGFEPPADFLDVAAVHGLFSVHREAAQRAFRQFVLSAIERLGSDPFRGQTPALQPRATREPPTIASRPSSNLTHALPPPS